MIIIEDEIFRVIIRNLSPNGLHPNAQRNIVNAIHFFEGAFKSNFLRNNILNFGANESGFELNLGLNNMQIYNKLMNAIEINGNVQRNVADLFLTILHEKSPDGRTIGFVNTNSSIIFTYEEFIFSLGASRLAAHFAHEWTHLLGFRHPVDTGTNGAFLNKTVPYAIQNLVDAYVSERQRDLMLI